MKTKHSALHVFTKMRDRGIFSLPVVDETGRLVAVAEGKDLVRSPAARPTGSLTVWGSFLKDPSRFELTAPILDFLRISQPTSNLATLAFDDDFTRVWELMVCDYCSRSY